MKWLRLGIPEFDEVTGKDFGTAKEFHDYDKQMEMEYPIRFKIYTEGRRFWWRIKRRIKDSYYWFQYRFNPRHQYTTIKLQRLEPGYYDDDTLIMYAMFEIFERFMERQLTNPHHVWEYSEEHFRDMNGNWIADEEGCRKEIQSRNETWNEMKTLYRWWTVDRPDRKNRLPEYPKLPEEWGIMAPLNEDYDETPEMVEWDRVSAQIREQEKLWEQEDEDMMIRLIKIRRVLWD